MNESTSSCPRILDVRVVVPARDEERTLGACLNALTVAMDGLETARPELSARVRVVLVLDTCRDSSSRIARRAAVLDPRIHTIERRHGSVGVARRDGARVALELDPPVGAAGLDTHTTWIASTDADSTVPVNWLTSQLEFADDGVDLLLGTVALAPGADTSEVSAYWLEGYSNLEGHPHIHGANLGVRASTYRAAGEFPALRVHEDVGLVSAVTAAGGTVRSSARLPVVTSARRIGRTPGGFATFLSDLCGPELRPRDNRDTAIVRSFG